MKTFPRSPDSPSCYTFSDLGNFFKIQRVKKFQLSKSVSQPGRCISHCVLCHTFLYVIINNCAWNSCSFSKLICTSKLWAMQTHTPPHMYTDNINLLLHSSCLSLKNLGYLDWKCCFTSRGIGLLRFLLKCPAFCLSDTISIMYTVIQKCRFFFIENLLLEKDI